MLLNNTWIEEEMTSETGKKYKLNENQPTAYQNLCEIAKEDQRGHLQL